MFFRLLQRKEHHDLKKRPVALDETAPSLNSTTAASTSSPTFSTNASMQTATAPGTRMATTQSATTNTRTPSKNEKGKPRSDIIQHVSVGSVVTPINVSPKKRIACCVCEKELKPGSNVKLPCKHAAHEECGNEWLNREVLHLKPGCPACSGERFERNPYSAANAVILCC